MSAPQHRELSIQVNGERRNVPEGCTVEELVETLGFEKRRIAVAVNREVVPRAARADRRLGPGDRVEILEAVGGG